MDWSLILACAHHIAVFSLVGIFAAEFTLIRPGLTPAQLPGLSRIDAAYGGIATLVIIVGIVRVWLGTGDPSYYLGNWAFWAKMAAFTLMGILTIPPTLAIRRWLKAGDIAPSTAEIVSARRYVHLQAVALLFIPIFAAAMARGYGA
jgi:putative membrane protein